MELTVENTEESGQWIKAHSKSSGVFRAANLRRSFFRLYLSASRVFSPGTSFMSGVS